MTKLVLVLGLYDVKSLNSRYDSVDDMTSRYRDRYNL